MKRARVEDHLFIIEIEAVGRSVLEGHCKLSFCQLKTSDCKQHAVSCHRDNFGSRCLQGLWFVAIGWLTRHAFNFWIGSVAVARDCVDDFQVGIIVAFPIGYWGEASSSPLYHSIELVCCFPRGTLSLLFLFFMRVRISMTPNRAFHKVCVFQPHFLLLLQQSSQSDYHYILTMQCGI